MCSISADHGALERRREHDERGSEMSVGVRVHVKGLVESRRVHARCGVTLVARRHSSRAGGLKCSAHLREEVVGAVDAGRRRAPASRQLVTPCRHRMPYSGLRMSPGASAVLRAS